MHVKENREISSLANENQLLKNFYDVTVIFDIVKFLASNEHSVRGDDESYSVPSSETCPLFGLFLRYWWKAASRPEESLRVLKRALGQPISGFILQEEALVFSTKLGIDDFVANSGWLRNFKSWHGILELKIYGEKLSADS
ncbi:Major centromere autoantigen [Trichinella pseudospiralis]